MTSISQQYKLLQQSYSMSTKSLIINTIVSSGFPFDGYRYYNCVLNHKGDYDCTKINSPFDTNVTGIISSLQVVPLILPEACDTLYIKYNLIPKINIK